MACDLCASVHSTFLFEKASYAYYRCDGCGLIASDFDLTDVSELYDGLFEREWLEREVRRTLDPRKQRGYLRQIRRRIRGSSRVLDVGCGVGGFLEAARRLGHEVQGIEVSNVASRHAREVLGLSVDTCRIEDWNGANGSYDLARVNALLEHVKRPSGCLAVAARALRPGGIVFGLTLNAASLTFRRAGAQWRYVGMGGHVTLFTPPTLRQFLERAGFQDVRTWTTGFRADPGGWPGLVENLVGWFASAAGVGHRLYFEARRRDTVSEA